VLNTAKSEIVLALSSQSRTDQTSTIECKEICCNTGDMDKIKNDMKKWPGKIAPPKNGLLESFAHLGCMKDTNYLIVDWTWLVW